MLSVKAPTWLKKGHLLSSVPRHNYIQKRHPKIKLAISIIFSTLLINSNNLCIIHLYPHEKAITFKWTMLHLTRSDIHCKHGKNLLMLVMSQKKDFSFFLFSWDKISNSLIFIALLINSKHLSYTNLYLHDWAVTFKWPMVYLEQGDPSLQTWEKNSYDGNISK